MNQPAILTRLTMCDRELVLHTLEAREMLALEPIIGNTVITRSGEWYLMVDKISH